VLWGDHGYKLGEYGLWCKHTNLELDTRVPLIISAPGLERGKHSKALVEIVDLFPTLARLTGGEAPKSCDGQSLEALLRDPGQAFRPYALSQYPRGKVMGYSLRTDRWRYTEWINSETRAIVAQELYDQGETIVPTQNLAGDPAYRQQVAALAQQLSAAQRVKQFQAKAGE
jgi:iduronate 2-sulfatase